MCCVGPGASKKVKEAAAMTIGIYFDSSDANVCFAGTLVSGKKRKRRNGKSRKKESWHNSPSCSLGNDILCFYL